VADGRIREGGVRVPVPQPARRQLVLVRGHRPPGVQADKVCAYSGRGAARRAAHSRPAGMPIHPDLDPSLVVACLRPLQRSPRALHLLRAVGALGGMWAGKCGHVIERCRAGRRRAATMRCAAPFHRPRPRLTSRFAWARAEWAPVEIDGVIGKRARRSLSERRGFIVLGRIGGTVGAHVPPVIEL